MEHFKMTTNQVRNLLKLRKEAEVKAKLTYRGVSYLKKVNR